MNDGVWDDMFTDPYRAEHDAGREQGRQDGRDAGFREGHQLGRTTALEYGMELGFVQGVLNTLQLGQDTDSFSDEKRERILRSMANIQRAVDDFPDSEQIFQDRTNGALNETAQDDENSIDSDGDQVDVVGKMQRVRARFKLLTVQLGIPHFSLKQVMDEVESFGRAESKSNESPNLETQPNLPSSEW